MARYIDADKLIFQLRQNQMWTKSRDLTEAIITVQNQPTADVVEVVRCKECTHGHWNQETCHGKPIYYCDRTDLQVSKYSFCSYGERKDAE